MRVWFKRDGLQQSSLTFGNQKRVIELIPVQILVVSLPVCRVSTRRRAQLRSDKEGTSTTKVSFSTKRNDRRQRVEQERIEGKVCEARRNPASLKNGVASNISSDRVYGSFDACTTEVT
jgi:hypothetical protein